jgi:hypothetical protein
LFRTWSGDLDPEHFPQHRDIRWPAHASHYAGKVTTEKHQAASVGGLFQITACDVAYWQILLQKSKIEQRRKSRESNI